MEQTTREERDIRELVHRANTNADKSGSQRQRALNKLIEVTRTPSASESLKILAAKNIPALFNDFPDQEEAAINAVYDLCEDQATIVRKAGYDAITAVSKAANKWVKRNTDVLLQLLQSDEPDEVVVVKQALIAHLNLDPRVTLGVLCDQIMPATDVPADPDELYMRDRLRALVLAFLTGEARQVIVDRHAVPDSEAEHVLIDGLLTAIPKLSSADTEIVVKQLLLHLRALQSGSAQGNDLLQALIEKAQLCFKADAVGQPTLASTRFYMDLMHYLVITKSLGSPLTLLRFYLPSLVTKTVIVRLSPDDQLHIICNMAETLAVCEGGDKGGKDDSQLTILRNQSVHASPILFECLAKAGVAHERSRNACKVLLESCLRRKTSGNWILPTPFRAPLETLRAKSGQFKDIQDLIRSLVAQDQAPSNGAQKNVPPVAGPSQQKPIVQVPPAMHRSSGLPFALRRPLPSPVVSASASRAGSAERNSWPLNKRSFSADNSPQPMKRARIESDDAPSLLSRLAGTEYRPNVARPQPLRGNAASAAVTQSEQIPRGGYSIKGAAKASGDSHPSDVPTSHSLLDRMTRGGGQSDDDRGRRKQNR
ncbi:hypothetical protein B0H15DRAFT_249294 [Mycena belliarum]|uniref:Uncharacterized protein n=1 Tax=Mycena belliarum TaxID=1033014 RepID=A0AAD6XRY9_9AGAR|nr:hypothetical protein B0H15DRAFT_249294 [Mycena belliae]